MPVPLHGRNCEPSRLRVVLAESLRIKLVDLDDTLFRLGRYFHLQTPSLRERARFHGLLAQYLRLLREAEEIRSFALAQGWEGDLWTPQSPRRIAWHGEFQDMRRYF